MGLNKSKGNMYDFVTHTWNTIKGRCYHDCSYCYMKRWGNLKPVRFDEKELNTNLGNNNFIFVGSSNDMFAENIPANWISDTLEHCNRYNNRYLFQTKNPYGAFSCPVDFPRKSILCVTIETNRYYKNIMNNSPQPVFRYNDFLKIDDSIEKFITMEPILDFDPAEMIEWIKKLNVTQVNIGADTGNNNLPEPSAVRIRAFIRNLKKHTNVVLKNNLGRLVKLNEVTAD